jgi:hypothetical protein
MFWVVCVRLTWKRFGFLRGVSWLQPILWVGFGRLSVLNSIARLVVVLFMCSQLLSECASQCT